MGCGYRELIAARARLSVAVESLSLAAGWLGTMLVLLTGNTAADVTRTRYFEFWADTKQEVHAGSAFWLHFDYLTQADTTHAPISLRRVSIWNQPMQHQTRING